MPQPADEPDDDAPASHGARWEAASRYFDGWPAELTPAQAALRHQLQAFVSCGAMLHVYVLQRGVLCQAAPLAPSVPRAEPRQCFRNAAQLAMEQPETYTYVEGYAQNMLATPHAWCVTADGTVVDPTWERPETCAYLGIPFDIGFLRRRALASGHWGVFGEMATRELLRTPVAQMVHPRWRAEIAARPTWPALSAALGRAPKKADGRRRPAQGTARRAP